jgi:hypothetical protein
MVDVITFLAAQAFTQLMAVQSALLAVSLIFNTMIDKENVFVKEVFL